MVEPIKPTEVTQQIPEWVIKGTNDCIEKYWRELKKQSHFTQDALIECILVYAPEGVTRQTIFDNDWLDIEPIYRKVGWNVEYDKPAYCESYDPNFTFSI